MELKEYFETRAGTGVLATADGEGVVDAAIYARPHFLEDGLGFIMPDRRTHRNLAANPHATYLFMEEPSEGGKKHVGKRLYLRKKGEEQDTERLHELRRRPSPTAGESRYLVLFDVVEVRPLVGDAADAADE